MFNKIISFSLYGNNPKYIIGAQKNIEICNEILPDWTIKIYTNTNVTSHDNINFIAKYNNVIIVDPESILPVDNLYNFCMFWRYLSFFYDDHCIVRDLDSRISIRETQYINNWLASDKDFFIIRDHPWHSTVPGGLVGMKNFGETFRNFFIDFVSNNTTGWGTDQEMLEQFVGKYANINNIYKCEFNQNNYIPRDNKSFFIGIQLDENDNPICIKSLQYLLDLNL